MVCEIASVLSPGKIPGCWCPLMMRPPPMSLLSGWNRGSGLTSLWWHGNMISTALGRLSAKNGFLHRAAYWLHWKLSQADNTCIMDCNCCQQNKAHSLYMLVFYVWRRASNRVSRSLALALPAPCWSVQCISLNVLISLSVSDECARRSVRTSRRAL